MEADAQLRQADSAYDQGKNEILDKQSDWQRKMEEAYRKGKRGFADAERKLANERSANLNVIAKYSEGRKKSLLKLNRWANVSLKNVFADLPSPINIESDIAMVEGMQISAERKRIRMIQFLNGTIFLRS